MCWSILKVTGVYDRYLKAEEAELDKSKPLTGPAANDPAARRARAIEVEQRTFDKLKGNVPAFIAIYAAARRTASERLLRHGRPGPLRGQRRVDQ